MTSVTGAARLGGLTVFVETGPDGAGGEAALASLARQTLPRESFETVLLTPDADPTTPVPAPTQPHPLATRRLPTPGGTWSPRVLASARRELATVIGRENWVGNTYLSELDQLGGPRVAVVTPVADVAPDGGVQFRHGVNREALRLAGAAATWRDVPLAASPGIGRAIPVAAALEAMAGGGPQPADGTNPPAGTDWSDQAAWWAWLFHAADLSVRAVPPASGAIYYRPLRTGEAALDAALPQVAARVRELGRLAGERPGAARLALALADAEGTGLGLALRDAPGRRGEVAAALGGEAARDVGRAVIRGANRAATDLLVVSYAFPPFLDTSGIVVAKRLLLNDEPFDLITHNLAPKADVDPRLGDLIAPLQGAVTTVSGPPRTHKEASLERWCREGLAAVREREWEFGPYRRLYSRSMWPASHVLAAVMKARQPGLKWTAEFSDPLLVDSRGMVREAPLWDSDAAAEIAAAITDRGLPLVEDRGFFGWLEGIVYALADRIVFTNPNQREFMANYPERAGGKLPAALARRIEEVAVEEPHPVPPPSYYERGEADYELDENVVNIGYFGVFYATRGVGDILEAFSQLGSKARRRVRLHIFTDKARAVADSVARAGLSDVVAVAKLLPYLDFLNLARRFDWLIVADARVAETHGTNPYLPSKLSDYRGAGAKIWGLVEPGSVLSTQPLDAQTNLDDPKALTTTLRMIINS